MPKNWGFGVQRFLRSRLYTNTAGGIPFGATAGPDTIIPHALARCVATAITYFFGWDARPFQLSVWSRFRLTVSRKGDDCCNRLELCAYMTSLPSLASPIASNITGAATVWICQLCFHYTHDALNHGLISLIAGVVVNKFWLRHLDHLFSTER